MRKEDILNVLKCTPWRDVVKTVMYSMGNKVHYKDVVEAVKDYKKASGNNHLSEKIRQVLRSYDKTFKALGNGYYCLAS